MAEEESQKLFFCPAWVPALQGHRWFWDGKWVFLFYRGVGQRGENLTDLWHCLFFLSPREVIMLIRKYSCTHCYPEVYHLALSKTELHWWTHCLIWGWQSSQKSEFKHDATDFSCPAHGLFTLTVWWDIALAPWETVDSFHGAPECTSCISIKMQRPNQADHTSQIFQSVCNSPWRKAKSS